MCSKTCISSTEGSSTWSRVIGDLESGWPNLLTTWLNRDTQAQDFHAAYVSTVHCCSLPLPHIQVVGFHWNECKGLIKYLSSWFFFHPSAAGRCRSLPHVQVVGFYWNYANMKWGELVRWKKLVAEGHTSQSPPSLCGRILRGFGFQNNSKSSSMCDLWYDFCCWVFVLL